MVPVWPLVSPEIIEVFFRLCPPLYFHSIFQATEFVVLYQSENETSPSILCPSFSVLENETAGTFSCAANLMSSLCGQKVAFSLEAWMVTGDLFEPRVEDVLVDCTEEYRKAYGERQGYGSEQLQPGIFFTITANNRLLCLRSLP